MSHEYTGPTRTAFGVFYPKEHVMAALPDLERAEAARVALTKASYDRTQFFRFGGGTSF